MKTRWQTRALPNYINATYSNICAYAFVCVVVSDGNERTAEKNAVGGTE
jgi:hypothetical protein